MKRILLDKLRNQTMENYSLTPADITDNGYIIGPGKFEGNPLYTIHYYDLWMNGTEDFESITFTHNPVALFVVTPEEREAFPELGVEYGVMLEQTDNGFINIATVSSEERYHTLIKELEAISTEE